MATKNIPLIFGAHKDDTGISNNGKNIYGYSIFTAHKNQGTLKK